MSDSCMLAGHVKRQDCYGALICIFTCRVAYLAQAADTQSNKGQGGCADCSVHITGWQVIIQAPVMLQNTLPMPITILMQAKIAANITTTKR